MWCILYLMKILIVPLITSPKADAAYFITRNLADLFTQEGHSCAVCASADNQFHNVSLYACSTPKRPLFPRHTRVRSYEEWMYAKGALAKEYIIDDTEAVQEAIRAVSAMAGEVPVE